MTYRICLMMMGASLAFAQGQGGAGQTGGTGGGTTGGAPGGVGGVGGTTGTTNPGRTSPTTPQPNPNDPNMRQQQQQQMSTFERPIFLSGKVVTEDGAPPPEHAVIERICNGIARPEGYTDSKGRFSIQLGQNQAIFADASVGSGNDGFGGFPGQPRAGSSSISNPMGGPRISDRDLMGCEIRASLSGYRSDVVNLAGRRGLENPDVGTIVIRRLAGVTGFATSMTTLMAPKDAKKSYEKSQDLLKKKKLPEAQKELEKAVQSYPKYAIAWYDLGRLHQQANRVEEARGAYQQALAADGKYLNPYLQIALLAAGEQKWQEVADNTDKVIRLNPVEFPAAFFYNSVANYNLQKYEESEKSAREAVKLDSQHRLPKAQHLLGILLSMKNDYSGAAENMRGYLKFAPQATDLDAVRKQLTEIEKRLNQTQEASKQ